MAETDSWDVCVMSNCTPLSLCKCVASFHRIILEHQHVLVQSSIIKTEIISKNKRNVLIVGASGVNSSSLRRTGFAGSIHNVHVCDGGHLGLVLRVAIHGTG